MYHVYLIQSINYPEVKYVGYTINLDQIIETHNSGGSVYTAKSRPWKLIMYLTLLIFLPKIGNNVVPNTFHVILHVQICICFGIAMYLLIKNW